VCARSNSKARRCKACYNAVDFIEQVRQADALASVPVGRRVVVIGGGNTAIDAAVQSRKLGAATVTMVYRRGVETMGATWAEREFAQTNGVTIVTHAKPVRLTDADGQVTGVEFENPQGERFVIEADMVLKLPALHRRILSGSRPRRPPTKPTTSIAPSKRAGAALYGKRSASIRTWST
jgi:NADPH-dependent glutamate synthase beta subunit-like oxidoreductase